MSRKYAEQTTVSVGRSRGEIDDLLRKWGCAALSWSDNFEQGWAQLSFAWKREDNVYLARFRISIPRAAEIHNRAVQLSRKPRVRKSVDQLYEELRRDIGKQEHRVLHLWIKAALNAVEAGIIPAEAIFLPFLVGRDGQTVADVALPRLPTLLSGGASLLLGEGE